MKATTTPTESDARVARARSRAAAAGDLADLGAALRNFDGFHLKDTATNTVFADGDPAARVMVVGEAPGRQEDVEGRPFVGAAGELLDKMLAAIDLHRSSGAYISNVVFWRPPGNRAPTQDERAVCRPFVERHVALKDPDFLLLMGGPASKSLLGGGDGILKMRGKWFDYANEWTRRTIPALVTLHPAFLLRTPERKHDARDDLKKLRAALADG